MNTKTVPLVGAAYLSDLKKKFDMLMTEEDFARSIQFDNDDHKLSDVLAFFDDGPRSTEKTTI